MFSKDQKGKRLFRVALKEEGKKPEELIKLRTEFGPGNAGQISFMYIAANSTCEECGQKRGEVTLYYDAGGGEDFTILCKDDYETVRKRYYDSIESQGLSGVASLNGWGRV